MNLTTKERCIAYLEKGWQEKESLLNQLIGDVSAGAETYMLRSALATTYTEYFDVTTGRSLFSCKAYPITSVTSVANDIDRAWGSTTLLDSGDYAAHLETGLIEVDQRSLITGSRVLRIVYIGGMAATTDAFVAAYPDISKAVTIQVVHEFRRSNSLQGDSITTAAGSVAFLGGIDWLAHAKAILDTHKRIIL